MSEAGETDASDLVLLEVDGGVALVTLNRPDRLNAWTRVLERRWFDVIDQIDDDPAIRAAVVTGAGRGFCPGMDTQVLDKASQSTGETVVRRPMTAAIDVRKPMIAAVNGACAGIGLVQALVCDVRFAAAGAKLATSFTRRGLPAEFGAAWFLTRLVGAGHAMDLLLSGRPVTAEEALSMGLVNRVYPPDELLPAALAYARDLADNCSPVAMAAVKAQVAADWHRGHREALEEAVTLVGEPGRRVDFREGVASYIEKRPPHFRGLPPRGVSLDGWE